MDPSPSATCTDMAMRPIKRGRFFPFSEPRIAVMSDYLCPR